ncbi:uncharacterized protein BT62DRAFT_6701 [Guyanagaster necrorhizus]|uniref:Uncharacterized protein n=1 Tax=Guyanagaster necrorhizus TaxID=856835 RepID=A0A9P8AYD0_9AGAR|nr:uncharacterized protein BT62DRAFT_6701 [Guyanagaster necrorhizus MCA 3950]KAG7452523.1 hypothetical protein BT62DRAFT_6701 [Guyanagaster necrorhizus MCA 3950]
MLARYARSARCTTTVARPTLISARLQSNTSRKDTPLVESEHLFAKPALFVLDVAKRTLKFTFGGLVIVGVVALGTHEAYHQWIERVELAPRADDEEVRKWEWDVETLRWSGHAGGTDPGLGMRGRHLVRAAWASQTWAPAVGITPPTKANPSNGLTDLSAIVDARLYYGEKYLREALAIAEEKESEQKLHPSTLPTLLTRHAIVLEKMGRDSWAKAKSQYGRVWASEPSASVALKIGDLSNRMGQKDDALAWWARAIQLTQKDPVDATKPAVPTVALSSPSAQRILSSVLVSLSAFYATTHNFQEAEEIEYNALNTLRSMSQPESPSVSPSKALHTSTLLQRSAVLSVHRAEVLYARGKSPKESIKWLSSAAESSESVVHALTGPKAAGIDQVSPIYKHTKTLQAPAIDLLRDARRTASEAWNLMGILKEQVSGHDQQSVLECYDRALHWAGKLDDFGERIPDVILSREWKVIMDNYTRLKRAIQPESHTT